jgi:hypothetical protein
VRVADDVVALAGTPLARLASTLSPDIAPLAVTALAVALLALAVPLLAVPLLAVGLLAVPLLEEALLAVALLAVTAGGLSDGEAGAAEWRAATSAGDSSPVCVTVREGGASGNPVGRDGVLPRLLRE